MAVELGVQVTGRDLGYDGVNPPGTSSLQTMRADAILCPRAYLEIFPAALLTLGPLAGLGAYADYRRSVGFEVRAGSQTHSAQLSRLATGLIFRLPPLSRWRLGLTPAVSYERREATVARGAIPGLPDSHLQGVRVGSGLAFPVGGRSALLLGAGYVFWTSARDLVRGDVPFFPSGKASALEVEAGVSLALSGTFSAHVVGEYSSTGYSLDPDPSGTYRASRATDRYLGGRAGVRTEF